MNWTPALPPPLTLEILQSEATKQAVFFKPQKLFIPPGGKLHEDLAESPVPRTSKHILSV